MSVEASGLRSLLILSKDYDFQRCGVLVGGISIGTFLCVSCSGDLYFMISSFWEYKLAISLILRPQASGPSSFHRKKINFFRDGLASSFLSEISGPSFPSELLVPPVPKSLPKYSPTRFVLKWPELHNKLSNFIDLPRRRHFLVFWLGQLGPSGCDRCVSCCRLGAHIVLFSPLGPHLEG